MLAVLSLDVLLALIVSEVDEAARKPKMLRETPVKQRTSARKIVRDMAEVNCREVPYAGEYGRFYSKGLEDLDPCDVDHTATSILAGVRAGSFG